MSRPKNSLSSFCLYLFFACSVATNGQADEFGDIKIIRAIPLSESEIRSAYLAAKADACEQVGEGLPLEMTSFTPYLTPKDKLDSTRRPLSATRRGFMSIGIKVEETGLPLLSKSKILDYVDRNFVTLQARIRKDLLDRELYYHHRPIAVTCQYAGSKLTKSFEPVVAQTASNIRSLGVFAETDKRPLKAEYLRTIVLAFRYEKSGRSGRTNEDFELAIIRGKESADGLTLTPHVFVTLDNRTRLTYIKPFNYPKQLLGCSITGSVRITEFDSTTGLYPKKSVTQSYVVASSADYDRSKLEEYCQKSFEQPMATSLVQLLDDIIDGKVPNSDREGS